MNIVEIVIKGIDKTKDGFTGAINNLSDLEKRVGQIIPALATMAVTAGAGFLVMAKGFIDTAAEADKTAQKVGLSVKAFSTLDFVAQKKGVDNFTTSLKKLSQEMEAAQVWGSGAADTFARFGVAVRNTDGTIRNTEDALLDWANVFSSFRDDASKTALAVQLFGREGLNMIPMLNLGAAGIESMREHAAEMGYEFDKVTAGQAKEFKKMLKETSMELQGMANMITAACLPSLLELMKSFKGTGDHLWILQGIAGTVIDMFAELVYMCSLVKAAFLGIVGAVKVVADAVSNLVSNVWDFFKIFGNVLGSYGAMIEQAMHGNFTAANQIWQKGLADMEADYTNFKSGLGETGKQIEEDVLSMVDAFASAKFPNIRKPWESAPASKPDDQGKDSMSSVPLPGALREEWARAQDAAKEYQKLSQQLLDESLRGGEKVLADEQARYRDEIDMIVKKADQQKIADEDLYPLLDQAAENHQQRLNEIYQQGTDFRAELDEAYKNGQIARYVELEQSRAAAEQRGLDSSKAMMQTYTDIARTAFFSVGSFVNTLWQTAKSGFGNAIANVVTGAQTAGEAFAALGKQMLSAVINFFAQWALGAVMQAVLGKALMAASVATGISAASALAGAWAAAATGAAIATFGAATSAAAGVPIAIASNVAFAQAAAFGGAAHGGLDYVPAETTYLLQKGERVLSTNQNSDFTNALQNGGIGGGGSMTVQLMLDGRKLSEAVFDMTRSGQMTIHPKSVRDERV